MNMRKKIVSDQALAVYRVLSTQGKSLTAEQIAQVLGVLPNTVYRAARQLLEVGVIKKPGTYPEKFEAISTKEALPWYLMSTQQNFQQTFGTADAPSLIDSKRTSLTIIKNRDDLLRKTNQDAQRAVSEINFMVSGLEVPDETILLYRKAIARGVKVRALVQQRRETSTEKLEAWKDSGVECRYVPFSGIRLFVFDAQIAYLISYDKSRKQEAFGVRFNYPPAAAILNSLFGQKWPVAQTIP